MAPSPSMSARRAARADRSVGTTYPIPVHTTGRPIGHDGAGPRRRTPAVRADRALAWIPSQRAGGGQRGQQQHGGEQEPQRGKLDGDNSGCEGVFYRLFDF